MTDPTTPSPAADDARRLRALAHPVRVRLLVLLRDGPAKVSDLAEMLGEPPNSVSFHLRQLLKYDMVRKVPGPEGSSRRESWWGAIERRRTIFDPATWEGEARPEALALLRAALVTAAYDRIDAIMAAIEAESSQGGRTMSGQRYLTARLTEEEASRYSERLRAVLDEVADLAAADEADHDLEGTVPWTFVIESYPDLRIPR